MPESSKMDEITIHSRSVVMRDPRELIPHPSNVKDHTVDAIAEVAGMIQQFGFTRPVFVDENDEILIGHKGREAAIGLRMPEVPVVVVRDLSETRKRALRIADNKAAENSAWDKVNLKLELKEIMDADPADLGLTGFDFEEVEEILSGELGELVDDGEEDPIPQVHFLTIGQHKIELTAGEKETLVKLASDWSKRVGSYDGLARFLVMQWEHGIETGAQDVV